jgi:hypothetical protein
MSVSRAVDKELGDVAGQVEQARVSAAERDWLRAAQALLAVQDKVGRVLREIELQRATPPRPDGQGDSAKAS